MTTEYQQLLDQYYELDKRIEGLDDERRELQERVNSAFAVAVKEKNLLAPLPWVLGSGCTHLEARCDKKHPESWELLDKFLGATGWHFNVKLLDGTLLFNDNDLSIYFDKPEQCIAFCRAYGITPSLKEIHRERDNAQERLKTTTMVLEAFGAIQKAAKCPVGHEIAYEHAFCTACAEESAPG